MRELGRRADLSITTVSRVLSGELSPTWEFCAAVATPLGENPIRVFRLAGLLPQSKVDENDLTFREILTLAEELTVEQREHVLRYLMLLIQEERERKKAEKGK